MIFTFFNARKCSKEDLTHFFLILRGCVSRIEKVTGVKGENERTSQMLPSCDQVTVINLIW